ncbi:MAG: RHS repeat-associated core domain-containing protein, partial [Deltaproteobacteria bacterium]
PIDFETGLFYYGYRYYDPATGRWPSRDPIEEEGGVNVYAFTFNNPICEIDLIGNSVYLFQSESPRAAEPAGLDEIRMKARAQESEMTKKLEEREREQMIDKCHFVWYDADGKSTDMGYGVEAATDFKQMMKDEKFVFVGGDFNSCADDLNKFKRGAVNNKLKYKYDIAVYAHHTMPTVNGDFLVPYNNKREDLKDVDRAFSAVTIPHGKALHIRCDAQAQQTYNFSWPARELGSHQPPAAKCEFEFYSFDIEPAAVNWQQ